LKIFILDLLIEFISEEFYFCGTKFIKLNFQFRIIKKLKKYVKNNINLLYVLNYNVLIKI